MNNTDENMKDVMSSLEGSAGQTDQSGHQWTPGLVDPGKSEYTRTSENPQLYKNRGSGTEAELTYMGDERKLAGGRQPTFAIINEKPEHRLILWMKAQAFSNREIATKLGYSEGWVSQICRQPWFRQRLVQELETMGKDAVESILKGELANSIYTAVEIRDDHEAPKAVRLAAAKSLWETVLGKPTQRLETDNTHRTDSQSIEEIDKELAGISAQEKAHGLDRRVSG